MGFAATRAKRRQSTELHKRHLQQTFKPVVRLMKYPKHDVVEKIPRKYAKRKKRPSKKKRAFLVSQPNAYNFRYLPEEEKRVC